jgi:hypothetical protein
MYAMFRRIFLVNSVGDSQLAPTYGRKCENRFEIY